MLFSDSRPTRLLPQQAIDYLAELENELGRTILVCTGGGSYFNPDNVRHLIDRTWSRQDQNYTDEQKADAIKLVLTAGASAGQWFYRDHLPGGWFDDNEQRVNPQGDIYEPGDDALHVHSVDGQVVGELLEDRTFCTSYNFVSWYTYERNYGDRGLLEHANWSALLGDPLRLICEEDWQEKAAAVRAERERSLFASFIAGSRDRITTDIRQKYERSETNIANYTASLIAERKTLAQARRELEIALGGAEGQEDHWLKVWDALMAHPKLRECTFNTNNGLVLITDHLFMTHPEHGTTRYLGRIKLTYHPAQGYIYMENLDNPKGGRAHPHVQGNQPCWGSLGNTVIDLLSQNEIIAALDLAVMFLETFNPADDWGGYAAYWFEVDDDTPDFLKESEQPAEEAVPA